MSSLDEHGLLQPASRPAIPGGGPQSAAAVLDRGLADDPDHDALVGRYGRYTYTQLDEEVNRAAHALAVLGVRAGDRVAMALPNQVDIVVAFLAVMRLGALWVGINRALAPPEQAFMLRDAAVSVLLAEPPTIERLTGRRVDLPDLAQVVAVHEDGTGEWAERVAHASFERPPVDVDPFAPAAIAYTSGTTGFPKGVVHSQHNLLLPGAVARARGLYEPRQRHGVCLPLTILNLQALGTLVAFQVGACLVAMDRIDALGIADWVRRERIAVFASVPAILYDLLTHPDVTADDLASLTRPGVGGADCPEEFRALYRERFGAEVTVGYGLTEAPTAVTMTSPDEAPVPNSAGTALPHVRILVVDDDDRPLPPGEVGEICVAAAVDGPWAGVYTPMLGYWNQPDATRAALRGGLLHTGDLGCLDEHGNLFVKDRRNDLIIRGGANVYPAEVERVLHADERVAACAVVGEPDDRLGERVVAFVQPAPGAADGDQARDRLVEELRALCGRELARYKVPERWVFVDDFPRTPMGKIRKVDVKP